MSHSAKQESDAGLDPRYRAMFCDNRKPAQYISRDSNGWHTVKRRWRDQQIIAHLQGRSVIGLFPADWIDYMMFDLDNHCQTGPPIRERHADVLRAICGNPLIYRSSESGGIRICYPLDQEYPKRSVYGYAKYRLRTCGIAVKSGEIEIMATDKGDRLPFGAGSCLVDPVTFEPLQGMSQVESIDRAWTIWEASKTTIPLDLVEPKRLEQAPSGFVQEVERLIQCGLTADITTNDALLKLAYYYRANCAYSVERTRELLRKWTSFRHNGHSVRINRGDIENVYDQIDRILLKFKPSKATRKSKWLPCPRDLTLGDVRAIVSLFSTYRNQLAAFSMLKYVKNNGRRLNTEDKCKDKTEGREDADFMSNLYDTGFQQIWECAIPYKAFKRFDGFDKTCPIKTRLKLEDAGLLKLLRDEDKEAGRCRVYRICFNFATDSEEVTSLNDGLRKLNNNRQLREKYPRYRAGVIAQERDRNL